MRINLFDMDEFIELNHLEPVTSPVLFERGGIPNPDGLVSNRIFGVSVKSRRDTFAYIDLHDHFFHPHIYKIIRRIFRNIDKIVNGEMTVSLNANGEIVKDPNGETGIEFFYNNWLKIKWKAGPGMSRERVELISKSKKNEIFLTKFLVIPAFYRDIKTNEKGKSGGGSSIEINNIYTRLIRLSSLLEDRDMFDFSFHNTNYSIQKNLVAIYDYLKDKLDKKTGMLRKYLLGKNVDYCTRVVISAEPYTADNLEDAMVSFRYSGVPISQCCSLCFPFVVAWIRNFFERELIETAAAKTWISTDGDEIYEIVNPEATYNDTYIKKMIDKYISDPTSRFERIPVKVSSGDTVYLTMVGKYRVMGDSDTATIFKRHMTWTDLLFIACSQIVENKHLMVTRYPILNAFGIFISKIRISSTLKTIPCEINGTLYKWYPNVVLGLDPHTISNMFKDTLSFSNSYLAGLDGDYDGDQITSKIVWSQEANEECEKMMQSKTFYLNSMGGNMRTIDLEAIQTFYTLTKEPVSAA